MDSEVGQDFWEDNAFGFEGIFDMREDSENMKRFNKYLKFKGKELIEN